MQPYRLRWAVTAIVFSLAVGACRLTGLVTAPQPSAETPTVSPSTPTAAQPTRVLTTKERREESGDPPYIIALAYPFLVTAAGEDNGFNQAVQATLDRRYQEFEKSVREAPLVTDDPLMANLNSLSMDYRLYYSTDDLISVHFTVSEYHAGAAHPNGMSEVINYSLARDQVIALEDLFQPGTDYLQQLSDYCTKNLADDEFFIFPEGARPLPENYRNWNIVPEGVLITFDPYQVAPYAAGFIKVIVPFSVLRPYLAADSPIAH